MGKVLAKFQIRPSDIDADLNELANTCKAILSKYGEVGQVEINPVAFGLKEIIIILIMPDKGGTDAVEEELNSVEGVDRAEVIDVRLLFG